MNFKPSYIIIGLLVIFGVMGCSKYNSFTTKNLEVQESWAKVQSSYQLRSDKINQLVESLKGEKKFEQETLQGVVSARAAATQVKVDPTNLTPEKLKEFQAAQSQMSGAFGRLLAVSESYPDLKTSQSFRMLNAEISETENKIKVARDRFNTTVKDFNRSIQTFPGNLFAGVFGFQPKGFFEAEAGAQNAPTNSLKTLSN